MLNFGRLHPWTLTWHWKIPIFINSNGCFSIVILGIPGKKNTNQSTLPKKNIKPRWIFIKNEYTKVFTLIWLVVEPTHLKNMNVKLGSSSPNFRCENIKIYELPPPSHGTFQPSNHQIFGPNPIKLDQGAVARPDWMSALDFSSVRGRRKMVPPLRSVPFWEDGHFREFP